MVDLLSDAGRAGIIRRNAASERLYTDEEFEAARQAYIRERGSDPLIDDTAVTGWHSGTYHRTRWWWTPPWQLTRPWLPYIGRSRHGDEWCNSTLFIILPFMLGSLTIRYGRKLRTRADGSCDEIVAGNGYPNCPLCGFDHWPSCVPQRIVCERCGRKFGDVGDTGKFARQDGPHTRDGFLYCSDKCADHTTASLL
jgi:hypothetical protein